MQRHHTNFKLSSYLDFSPLSSNVYFDSGNYRVQLIAPVIQFCNGRGNLNIHQKATIVNIYNYQLPAAQ